MRKIETPEAPLPVGHYSQAVVEAGWVYLSGILPFLPGPDRKLPDGITAQTELVFAYLAAILRDAGSGFAQLVNVQVFLADLADWAPVNGIYARALGTHRPARVIVPCGSLSHGARIMLSGVARTMEGTTV